MKYAWHRACETREVQTPFGFQRGQGVTGKVFLIGAGPGDPELMTLKAARALRLADIVMVDELVNRGCPAPARSDAKVIEVGKRGGCKSTPQLFIEKLMIQYAKAGNTVARLKGGDPF